jgi:hypothetical protein
MKNESKNYGGLRGVIMEKEIIELNKDNVDVIFRFVKFVLNYSNNINASIKTDYKLILESNDVKDEG